MKDNEECFRVRGIPYAFDKAETEKHVKHALGLGTDTKMRIRSLAPEPYPSDEQMATVEFDTRPVRLSRDTSTREWSVSCDCDECISNENSVSLTLDSHFKDITVLHWPKEGKWEMDVIAVPGLGGHAFGSFKAKGGTEMWLRDYLPRQLPGARVFTYGYGAHLVGSNSIQGLGDLGIKCRDRIERTRRRPEISSMRKPIVLIGHSLGGIVLKEAILRMMDDATHVQYDEVLASITAVLFFGVPNHGMQIESLLSMVHNQPNEDLIRTLRHDSDLLIQQSERFLKNFQGKRRGIDFNRIELFSFYETQTSPTAQEVEGTWKMNGPRTILVGKSSATHGRPWEARSKFIRPIDTDHSGLVKFISRHDEHYLEVLSLLLDHAKKSQDAHEYHLDDDEAECLRSLTFPTQDLRLMSIETTENTSTWFTNHESYKKWINPNDQDALLSVVGHPGVGKSTLMKYAVIHAKRHFQQQAVILSFFFDGKTKENAVLMKSPLGFYRSLLHQILSIRPRLLSISRTASILSTFGEKKSRKGEAGKDWEWQEEELRGFLSSILSEALTLSPVFVFVDALDECDNFRHAKEIVEYFRHRISEIITTPPRLRVCFSCRKYLSPIPANAENHQVICVEEQREHRIAIQTAVEENLQDIQDTTKKNAVQTAIIQGAKGIFLWAIIVCRQAVEMADAGDSTQKIEEMVGKVPSELDDLFKDLLIKIPENKQTQSIKLFQWICYARQPLSIKEVQYALAIEADMKEETVQQLKGRSEFREDLDDVERAIKALSQGLAETRDAGKTRVVLLIHQTAFQYLTKSGLDFLEKLRCTDIAAQRLISTRTADCRGHTQLATFCMKCLRMPLNDYAGKFPTIRKQSHSVDGESYYPDFEMKPPGHQDWVYIHDYIPLFEYALSSATWHVSHGAERTQSYVPRYLRSPEIVPLWTRILRLTESKMNRRRTLSRIMHGRTFPQFMIMRDDFRHSFGRTTRRVRISEGVQRARSVFSVAIQPTILQLSWCGLYWCTETVAPFHTTYMIICFEFRFRCRIVMSVRKCIIFSAVLIVAMVSAALPLSKLQQKSS